MTKLYNFNAIESWDGYTPERLHGGNVRFRAGFARGDRRVLHEEVSWQRRISVASISASSNAAAAIVKKPIGETSSKRSGPRGCTRCGTPSRACSVSKKLPLETLPLHARTGSNCSCRSLFSRPDMNWLFGKRRPVATVAFNMIPRRGPYGGGNQWLNQLSSYLKRCGYAVQYHLDRKVDCVAGTHAGLSGGLRFRYEDVLRAKAKNPRLVCIQRINDNDARKGTNAMDRLLAEANRAADHTVFVSEWLRDYHVSRWFDPAKPHSVILNGADPSIFHPIGAATWSRGAPLRLVTHHWSDNMSKGFDLYQDIDEVIASGALRRRSFG